jgi:hypothetical protein
MRYARTHAHTHKQMYSQLNSVSRFFLLLSVTEQRTHAETTVQEQSTAGQQTTLELHAFV